MAHVFTTHRGTEAKRSNCLIPLRAITAPARSLVRLWDYRYAAPSEHDDSVEAGKRVKRFIAASSFCAIRAAPSHPWRCMPRWLSVALPLLAAGANEYERQELSRRAESASADR